MTPEVWKQKIKEAARNISDRDYQRETWFGKGREISSPDEMYSTLFDDFMLDRFLVEHRSLLTDRQFEAAVRLKERMMRYQPPEWPDPHKVIDDTEWVAIASAAKELVESMETEPEGTARPSPV